MVKTWLKQPCPLSLLMGFTLELLKVSYVCTCCVAALKAVAVTVTGPSSTWAIVWDQWVLGGRLSSEETRRSLGGAGM